MPREKPTFYDETSPDDGDHRLEHFLNYMSPSKAVFLIYSRMTDAQQRWLDRWLKGVVSRTPALRGRIEVLPIAPGPDATFRDPDLARALKLRLKTLIGL